MDERAMAPVIGKALEAGIVALYVSMLVTALYGGVVPEYRTAAGGEVADRTLAATVHEIERSVPAPATEATVQRSVELPGTIHDEPYELCANGRTVTLEHTHPEIGDEVHLALPERVESVAGCWDSTTGGVVVASGTESSVTIELKSGERR